MIQDLRVGTGGWAYFNIPGMDSLEAYARAFNYVEVNTTFYQVPPMDMVRSWRTRVPKDFVFTVRCHRTVTHAHAFDSTDVVLKTTETMAEIVRLLKAEVLHLLTPPAFLFEGDAVERLSNLIASTSLKGVPLALEPRAYADTGLPPDLRRLMEDNGIIHCVDLSKSEPEVESPLLYTRLFGKGYHTVYQFSDDELQGLHQLGSAKEYKRALFTFHGVRMYSDAGRFLSYARTGKFPAAQVPGQTKLD